MVSLSVRALRMARVSDERPTTVDSEAANDSDE